MTKILRFRSNSSPIEQFQVSKFKQTVSDPLLFSLDDEQSELSDFITNLSNELKDKNISSNQNTLPLTFSPPEAWTLFLQRKHNPHYLPFFDNIIKRDNFSCFHCGFQSEHNMEIVNKNNDYFDNHPDNLVTVCPFCAQCYFLDTLGQDFFVGGSLVYLPEMPQHILNSYCHVLFSVIENSVLPYYSTAVKVRSILRYRSKCIDNKLGKNFSNPPFLTQFLISANLTPKQLVLFFKDIRLMPAMNANLVYKKQQYMN